MPFYNFACPNCRTTTELLVAMGTESTACQTCGKPTVKQPSYRFNATGLPNGFSATRSKSRKDDTK